MVMRVNWGNACEVLSAECHKCKLLLLLGLLLLPPEPLIWPFQQPFKWKISLCDLPHWKGVPGYWWSKQSVCGLTDTKVKYVCFITQFLPRNYYFGESVLLDTVRKPQGLPSPESLEAGRPCVREALFPIQPAAFSASGWTPVSWRVIKLSWAFRAFSAMCIGLSSLPVFPTALPHHRRCPKKCELKPLLPGWTQKGCQPETVWPEIEKFICKLFRQLPCLYYCDWISTRVLSLVCHLWSASVSLPCASTRTLSYVFLARSFTWFCSAGFTVSERISLNIPSEIAPFSFLASTLLCFSWYYIVYLRVYYLSLPVSAPWGKKLLFLNPCVLNNAWCIECAQIFERRKGERKEGREGESQPQLFCVYSHATEKNPETITTWTTCPRSHN